jgi:Flp pilus assembly pilin Flp
LTQQLSSHSVRDEDHAMTIAEYAILSVLIAAVVVSLGLAFSERKF